MIPEAAGLIVIAVAAAAALGGMWLRGWRERRTSLPPGGVHYRPEPRVPAPGTFWVEGPDFRYVDERGRLRTLTGKEGP